MVPLWFTLSALCFVGAAVLLYVDLDRRRGLGRRRKSWAKSHGFDYEHESADILKRWKRGVMSTVGDVTATQCGARADPRRGGLHLRPRRRRHRHRAAPQGRHQRRRRPAAQGHQGTARERHLAARRDRPPDGVLHQPRRGPPRLRPPDGDVRPHRAGLRRDHVERAELDAGQHAGHQHPRPVGRGPAHRAPVQRPAAGAAADAVRGHRSARRPPQRLAEPSAHPAPAGRRTAARPAAGSPGRDVAGPIAASRAPGPARRTPPPPSRNGRQSPNYQR